ncbi:MAG: LysR family transcriptional regulator [Polyangiaceae bacterium]
MQRRGVKNRPPLAWDDARVFLTVVRSSSLVAAARALDLDKSTLSRRITRLERALGATLFVRTREGIRPSFVAERLRPHAERVEAEVLAFASAGVAAQSDVTGLVRIATTEGMAPRLVRAGLLELKATYPALELELLGGNRPVDIGRGEADLAIRVTPTKDARLVVRVVGRWPIALYASARYLRARGVPRSVAELDGHDLLVPSGELSALPEAVLLAKVRGARVALRSSSLPALVEAALLDHGLVPLTTAWGESVEGLSRALELESIAARPTWLVTDPDAGQRAAVRVVVERLVQAFRAVPGAMR